MQMDDTYLSAFFSNNMRFDVTDTDIRTSVKMATTILGYPCNKGIPIDQVDTHLLRSGGANALSLVGFQDQEIQKWVAGAAQHLKNTSGKNSPVSLKECPNG